MTKPSLQVQHLLLYLHCAHFFCFLHFLVVLCEIHIMQPSLTPLFLHSNTHSTLVASP